MKKSDINIDESSHREVPGLFRRLVNALYALIPGFVLAQVIVLIFSFGAHLLVRSIIPLLNNPFVIGYLIVCTVMGFIAGDRFTGFQKQNC